MEHQNFDVMVMKLDEVDARIITNDPDIETGINDFFKYPSPNAQYRKNRNWDGLIRLFKRDNATLPLGLVGYLYKYCQINKLTIYVDPKIMVRNTVDKEELADFLNDHLDPRNEQGEPLVPYDYQLSAIHETLVYQRRTLLAATSAGKSFILYALSRILELQQDKTILIVVPTKMLVEQLYSDFAEYSNNGGGWFVGDHVQKMNGDYATTPNRQIIIATWQTVVDLEIPFFRTVGAVFIDETHLAKAKSFQSILKKCTEATYRAGLTGTLDDAECNKLLIAGMLGPVKRIVTTAELIAAGRATPVKVRMLAFQYSDDECAHVMEPIKDDEGKVNMKAMYDKETAYVYDHPERNKFMFNLIDHCKGNTLILAEKVEKHLEVLYENYLATHPDRKNVFIICGSGKYAAGTEEKERIRKALNDCNDAVVFASFGTTSTGVNIKSLANLIVVSSTKSKIRILQSVGRIIRLFAGKGISNVYDFVDDFSWNGEKNIVIRHAARRYEFYSKDGHPVKLQKIRLPAVPINQ